MKCQFLKSLRFWRSVWFAALAVWCAFVFSNSLRPAEESSRQSRGVVQVIEETVQKIDPEFEISHKLVRKAAHFIEYFILGIIFSLSVLLWDKRLYDVVSKTLLSGILIALFDETLQLASEGRSGSVIDVWIDFSALVVSHFLFFALFYIIKLKFSKKSL